MLKKLFLISVLCGLQACDSESNWYKAKSGYLLTADMKGTSAKLTYFKSQSDITTLGLFRTDATCDSYEPDADTSKRVYIKFNSKLVESYFQCVDENMAFSWPMYNGDAIDVLDNFHMSEKPLLVTYMNEPSYMFSYDKELTAYKASQNNSR